MTWTKEIELSKTGIKRRGLYTTTVDGNISNFINSFNWTADIDRAGSIYASRFIKVDGQKIVIPLHKVIWELYHGENSIPEGYTVDHIDRNPLNNVIWNLRLATRSQQMTNQNMKKHNKSGYKGVFYRKEMGMYEVKIGHNCKRYRLGHYWDIKEAAFIYEKFADIFHGSFKGQIRN